MLRVPRSPAACCTLVLAAALLSSCRESPAAPTDPQVRLAALGDPVVYVAAGATGSEPVRVAATDPATGAPVRGVAIEWRLVSGSGTLSPTSSDTDAHGVASTVVRPGAAAVYRVSASAPRLVGPAPEIEVRVVPVPVISSVEPQVVAAGGEVTVHGSNFGGDGDARAVYFDGIRGEVLSATPTELRVRVPGCVPARDVQVVVGLGAVQGDPRPLVTSGGSDVVLDLAPGEVRTFSDAALSCLRLPGGQRGTLYLAVLHNTDAALTPPAPFEFRSLTPRPPPVATVLSTHGAGDRFADSWEARLRSGERALRADLRDERGLAPTQAAAAVPVVGESREFSVLDGQGSFRKTTATVRAVTERAIIYVDRDADSAVTAEDVAYYGQVFDDPIYSTVSGVFGQPSDVDSNGRIIILLTPRVNELTPKGESSFVAGFFYGCDLVARNRCSGSNQAEVFYSIVPDLTGRWGDARSRAIVRDAVPPVMAHEYQHMIHFARRGFSSDVLWLSEALAHSAEELVADALAARGQAAQAAPFRNANRQRAQRYLAAPGSISLISDLAPGSLELRGGGWLFLRYLRGQYGGNDLLQRLTSTTRTGVSNVTHETGQNWNRLVADFGVALWADGAPQLRGALDPRYQFVGFDLRTTMGSPPGPFPLSPPTLGWRDFAVTGALPASANQYFGLVAPGDGSGTQLNMVVSGERGAPLTTTSTLRLSILRVN